MLTGEHKMQIIASAFILKHASHEADDRTAEDRKGVLMMEFLQHGFTIMSEVYCKTLKKCIGPFRTKGVEC
jgi:hypothetical protein